MRFVKKKDVHQDVISDQGVHKKTDSFSIAVIIISNIISAILIVLGALIFFNS